MASQGQASRSWLSTHVVPRCVMLLRVHLQVLWWVVYGGVVVGPPPYTSPWVGCKYAPGWRPHLRQSTFTTPWVGCKYAPWSPRALGRNSQPYHVEVGAWVVGGHGTQVPSFTTTRTRLWQPRLPCHPPPPPPPPPLSTRATDPSNTKVGIVDRAGGRWL